jgi:hypothetical protein
MSVEEYPRGVSLIVRGPGAAFETHDFARIRELYLFAEQLERTLAERGFQLQAVAERRRGRDRGLPPGTPDRRRR